MAEDSLHATGLQRLGVAGDTGICTGGPSQRERPVHAEGSRLLDRAKLKVVPQVGALFKGRSKHFGGERDIASYCAWRGQGDLENKISWSFEHPRGDTAAQLQPVWL